MKRIAACALAGVLLTCVVTRPASAQPSSEAKTGAAVPEPIAANPLTSDKEKDKLRADVLKLVADAKAGKLKIPAQHFPQPKRNNLSTGAKIAIIAGIGAAIFLIVMLVSLADDDS